MLLFKIRQDVFYDKKQFVTTYRTDNRRIFETSDYSHIENLKIVEKTIRLPISVEYCELREKIFGFFIVGTRKNP